MIYKFIDSNGAEITVNSLSSLQALVESQTIKKNTKVKCRRNEFYFFFIKEIKL